MPNRTKRATQEHLIGKEAVKILEGILPPWWFVREYKPDYGIDLTIELFEEVDSGSGKKTYDTLGEHLFVQVKGVRQVKAREVRIPSHLGPEKGPTLHTAKSRNEQQSAVAFTHRIDTSELLTSQRMGAALPVVLIVVDVSSRRAFFVCLTDYVDKIILPQCADYTSNQTKTIIVPMANEIKRNQLVPLQYYAKRPKLYAAFQKFAYQEHELNYVGEDELLAITQTFARILLRSDIWRSCQWWAPIAMAHGQLQDLVRDGNPRLFESVGTRGEKENEERIWHRAGDDDAKLYTRAETIRNMEIRTLWQQLANLGRVHEEICREWFLPTSLGLMTS